MRFILYARKSTDREDKQIQSIPDQIKVLTDIARDRGYSIVEIIQESASAKAPGRPLFNQLKKDIEAGKADGILCWKIDRLYRNPKDAGDIQWMMQQGALKLIQTMDRSYNPEDNVLLLNIESGMAHQYINDLRKNVNRGMNSKVEKGWMPGKTPVGYLNDPVTRTIINDPERFFIVKKAWETMSMGCYSVPQILEIATNEWGLTHKKTKNQGPRKIAESTLYTIFRNIFYTGYFTFAAQRHKGNHEAMITMEQYQKVQEILDGKQVNVVPMTHEHSYTGMIRCGECGYHITCDTKIKTLRKTGLSKTYQYYKCSGRGPSCSQTSLSTQLPELEKQIDDILASVEIRPAFYEWGMKTVKEHFQEESENRNGQLDALDDKIKRLSLKRENVLNYLLEGTITRDEFEKNKKSIENEIMLAESQKQQYDSSTGWMMNFEDALYFLLVVRQNFQKSNKKTKREMFRSFGQNFSIKERKLTMELHPWMKPIARNANLVCVGNSPSEPKENLSGKALMLPGEVDTTDWWTHLGSNQGPIGYEPTALTPEL